MSSVNSVVCIALKTSRGPPWPCLGIIATTADGPFDLGKLTISHGSTGCAPRSIHILLRRHLA